MLQIRLFHEFKGADTVLVWGDADGINELHTVFCALASGERESFASGGGSSTLTINVEARGGCGLSRLTNDPDDPTRLRWTCSRSVMDNTEGLLAALAAADHGHQYVDVGGPVATQIMFSKGEYPDEMHASD